MDLDLDLDLDLEWGWSTEESGFCMSDRSLLDSPTEIQFEEF